MDTLGILCGSGNLLFEAANQGIEVLGNIELRSYYHSARWVWDANFNAPLVRSPDGLEISSSPDIVLGHPPCGSFSTLGQSKASLDFNLTTEERAAWHKARNEKAGMIPEFIAMVNHFEPRIWAMDNLPKMLEAFPPSWWKEQLPAFKLTFITITNWDYGSPQRRRRTWVIGTTRKRRFRFVEPDQRLDGPRTGWEAISDLPWQPWIDIEHLAHVHHHPRNRAMGSFRFQGRTATAGSVGETALGYLTIPPGKLWPYRNAHGRYAKKPGHVRLAMENPCRTLSKMETLRHPLTGFPLTPRERARMMGWPDEFKMNGPTLDQGNIRKLSVITGKAVPNEFVRYLIPQLADHL